VGHGAARGDPRSRLLAAAVLGIAAACAAPPPAPEPPSATGELAPAAPVQFDADPLASALLAPAPQPAAAGTVIFAEDPFAGVPMAIPAGNSALPFTSLAEIAAPAPEPEFNADLIDKSSELGLAVLRARFLEEELGRATAITVPEGPFHFGEIVPVKFELRNPLGETVELLPPPNGLVLELSWEVERWLPIGGHDRVVRHRWYRLADFIVLQSDETYRARSEIPLVMEGDVGALWRVRVDARLRCAGALMGDRELPVHKVEFRSTRFFAFPEGWEHLRNDPLERLRRSLASADPALDRHVLIATALLTGEDRYRGLELLLGSLLNPASGARALTATAALQWLTQLPLGDDPADWIRWRAEQKITRVRGS
jgi:hypothetical protein